MRRLNLGCGHDLRDGWVNVDRDAHDMFGHHDFRRGDARDLAFPAEEFDVVLLRHVLGTLGDDDVVQVLEEAVRVLKFPGELVIVDDTRSAWSFGTLADWLLDAGLSVTQTPTRPIAGLERDDEFTIVGVKP